MPFKINIADKSGKTYNLESEAEELIGKELHNTISGKDLNPNLEDYEFEITGTSDKAGFTSNKAVSSNVTFSLNVTVTSIILPSVYVPSAVIDVILLIDGILSTTLNVCVVDPALLLSGVKATTSSLYTPVLRSTGIV